MFSDCSYNRHQYSEWGIFKEVSGGIKSEIRKPLLANTKSSGCNKFNSPQWPKI